MKFIREASESEMILEFLKGEMNSKRFNNDLIKVLVQLDLEKSIIDNGDVSNQEENKKRLEVMKLFRGYPTEELFENFPNIEKWKFMQLSFEDINHIYYIDYDYWNELSNNTSNPIEAANSIKNGIEIFDVSNEPFLDGVKYLENNKFSPVILITCNEEKYLIVEGHSRMTIYGFNPSKLEGTYAYVGYCSPEGMKKYDSRMLIGESLASRKYKKVNTNELK